MQTSDTRRLLFIVQHSSFIIFLSFSCSLSFAQTTAPIRFNTNFESASLGKIEHTTGTHYLCAVRGEQNFEGRNRQLSWYYFRMDNVRGRTITIELTDLVGEYNYRPGAIAIRKDTPPVFSYDQKHWQHLDSTDWDDTNKRLILHLSPTEDRIWIAHIQPYTTRDLQRLLDAISTSPCVRSEVIGKTVQGRDLVLLTATNFAKPDSDKKVVWLIARQHAWESGSSFVADGAIRFILSEAPEARRLRDRVIFKFIPMADPDGVARGGIRYNANGYDVNRHWDEVDLRDPKHLERMPEIWYMKKAIVDFVKAERPIDLLLYLHNEEQSDRISGSPTDDPTVKAMVARFYDLLVSITSFDSTRPPTGGPDAASGTSGALYHAAKVPALLMEQKITPNKKLGRHPTAEDRVAFGRDLVRCMAQAVLASSEAEP